MFFLKKKSLIYTNRTNILEKAISIHTDIIISSRVDLIKNTIIKCIDFEGCSIENNNDYIDINLKLIDTHNITILVIRLFKLKNKIMIELVSPVAFRGFGSSYKWRTLTIEQFNEGLTIS